MADPLDIMIVGGGSAGRRHFRYLSEYGMRCSVCDPRADCRVLQEFPDARHVRDYATADLSRLDAVVICTPPHLHVPQLTLAARAGCHVLSEKPLTVLHDEGLDELQATVKDRRLVAAVAFPYANMKAMDRIIEIHRSGELGRLWSIQVHHGQNILKPRPDYFETYYASDTQGGGALQDDAMHPLMGLERMLGPEVEVTCQRHHTGLKDISADDTAWLWLRYGDDVVVGIDYTLQCHWQHHEWILSFEKGAIRFLVEEPSIHVLAAETGAIRIERFDDDWNETFRANDINFVNAIAGREPVRVDLAAAVVNHRAVLAARRSAAQGRSVQLDEVLA